MIPIAVAYAGLTVASGVSSMISGSQNAKKQRRQVRAAINANNKQFDLAIQQTQQRSFQEFSYQTMRATKSLGSVSTSLGEAGVRGGTAGALRSEDIKLQDLELSTIRYNRDAQIAQLEVERRATNAQLRASRAPSYNWLAGVLNLGGSAMGAYATGKSLS